MLKRYFVIATLISLMLIAFSITTVFAQQNTPEPRLNAVDALNIAFETTDPSAGLVEIIYDVDNTCWYVVFTDNTDLCISDITGELVERVITPTPEVTPETTVTVTPETSSPSPSTTPTATPRPQTDVSVEEAIATALRVFPNSVVNRVRLVENRDGVLFWDVELDNRVRSVDINATSGQIVFFGFVRNAEQSSGLGEFSEPSERSAPEFSEPSEQSAPEFSEPSERSTPEFSEPSERSAPEFSEPSERSAPEFSEPSEASD